ncbi:MAG: hypothetical protein ACI81V_000096 [Lentimonas sp.]|jgi:hypothetical protein
MAISNKEARLYPRLRWLIAFWVVAVCGIATALHPLAAAQISAGNTSAFYINDSGDFFSWGGNVSGQLGDGTQAAQSSPVIVAEAGPWLTVATSLLPASGASEGAGHTLAIKQDGTLWAWGDNSRGQLGTGSQINSLIPVRIGSSSNWIAVEAGSGFSMALNSLGKIYVWGDNSYGQLGAGVSSSFVNAPRLLADKDGDGTHNDTFIGIAAGSRHALAIHAALGQTSGQIYGWGNNQNAQLGLGNNSSVSGPTLVSGGQFWRLVEAGVDSSFGINSSHKIYAWGFNGFGGLGTGSNAGTSIQSHASPTLTLNNITSSVIFKSVSAGVAHALAVSYGGGSVYATGDNAGGALGLSGSNLYNQFTFVSSLPPAGRTASAVVAGRGFSGVLLDDGVLLSTGSNSVGQLGNGTTDSGSSFAQTSLGAVDLEVDSITIISDVDTLSAGDTVQFQVIVKNNGTGTVDADASRVLSAVFNPTSTFNADGQLDFTNGPTFPLTGAITPGGSLTVTINADLPASIDLGEYYVLVDLDSTDLLEESDESNNSAASSSGALLNFRADLSVSLDAWTPASVAAGDIINVDITITNLGAGAIPAGAGFGFEYQIVLSEMASALTGSPRDLIIDAAEEFPYISGLGNAGSGSNSVTLTITAQVPEEVTLGNYYLGVVVDSSSLLDELDETNNTAFSTPGAVTVTGILIADALDIDAGFPAKVVSGADSLGKLTLAGDGDWYGYDDDTVSSPIVEGEDSLSSPSIAAGESATLRFEFAEPRLVTFRRKSATSSSSNYFFFGADGVPLDPEGTPSALQFGTNDWQFVSYVVEAGVSAGFTYVEGVDAADDRVFVDELNADTVIAQPDYVVDSIQYEAGDYVLQRDHITLTVTGSNRGANFPLPTGFSLQVWLSRDQEAGNVDDVSLGTVSNFQLLDGGTRFVYQTTFQLPASLEEAPYYILARADSTNLVDEFSVDPATGSIQPEPAAFATGDSNFRFSDNADVIIFRRPDLRVDDSNFFVGGPLASGYDYEAAAGDRVLDTLIIDKVDAGLNSEMAIGFDLLNQGLAEVSDPFTVNIYFIDAPNATPVPGNLIATFTENSGMSIGGAKRYEVTTSIADTITAGAFYYVKVLIDEAGEIPESREDNNGTGSSIDDLVFIGETDLSWALNDGQIPDDLVTPANATVWRQWEDGDYFSEAPDTRISDSPWFGQKTVYLRDSLVVASAQAGPVGVAGRSFMTTTLSISNGEAKQVAFSWKASSQARSDAVPIGDELIFEYSLNGGAFLAVPGVSNLFGEVEWTRVRHVFTESGDYILRWSYLENGDGLRDGSDAGWVDDFSIVAPDFTILDPLVVTGASGTLAGGDSFGLSFTIDNIADTVAKSLRYQIRLTKSNPNFSQSLDWTVGNFEEILLADSVVSFSESASSVAVNGLTLVIPSDIGEVADYYIAVWVDYDDRAFETDDTNNLVYTSSRLISLAPAVTFAVASNYTPDATNGWFFAGDGRWFPIDDEAFAGAGTHSVRNPTLDTAGQSAGFEAIVDGPKLLTFQWKSNVGLEENYAQVLIDGVVQRREFATVAGERDDLMQLTGVVDWREEALLIPAGTHVVTWQYKKQLGVVGVAEDVWVDDIDFATIVGSGSPLENADLAIVSVTYTGGEFALERDQLTVQIVVENRGLTGSLGAGSTYDDLDIEIRLSNNNIWGDSDDQVLGNLSVSDVLNSGERLVFSDSLDLPVHLRDESFYLLAEVQSLDPDFVELTYNGVELTANNSYGSTSQDIEILHLPRLSVALSDLAYEKVYYPKESIALDWSLTNIGLGDISGESYTQTIELWYFEDAGAAPDYAIDNASQATQLASITEISYLPGALSRDSEAESTLEYQTQLAIPRAGELLFYLGLIDEVLEDEDASVVSQLAVLQDYIFFFVITRDSVLPQSSNLSISSFTGDRFKIAGTPAVADYDYADWTTSITNILITPDLDVAPTAPGTALAYYNGSGFQNLFYYALDLPLDTNTRLDGSDPDTVLNRFGSVFLDTNDDGEAEEYQRLTFPIIRTATDLVYVVEATTDMVNWEILAAIAPPYEVQDLTNPNLTESLTNYARSVGDGYQPFVSISPRDYSATVTVRDYVEFDPLGGPPVTRFMRLRLISGSTEANVFRAVLDPTAAIAGQDADTDTFSNLLELMLGSDPTDLGSVPDNTSAAYDVAVYLISFPGFDAVLSYAPADDYDADGFTNQQELDGASDPTDATETP